MSTPNNPTAASSVEIDIPAGMKIYGPGHPDYPSEPEDWDGGAYLCRDGQMYVMRGYGWGHGTNCTNPTADWDRIAYTPRTTPTTEAGVAQADREAASKLARQVYGARIANDLSDGTIDQHHFLDAFLAHRIEATASLRAENEGLLARLSGLREALNTAVEQFCEPMSSLNGHELGERLASDVSELARHLPTLSHTEEGRS